MKIIRLEAENVKRLRAVSIKPDGTMVVIGGKNGAGKSSLLDSIEMALGGKSSIPGKPIRNGEKKARVVVETEEMKITRVFTEAGTRLVVENRDGAAFKSPQALLDNLVGNLSFDPLAFSNMTWAKQAETLRDLAGVDPTKLNDERQEFYEKRRALNREITNIKAQVDAIPQQPGVKEVKVSELMEELRRRNEVNAENERKRNVLAANKEALTENLDELQQMQEQLEDLQSRMKSKAEEIERDKAKLKQQGEHIAELKDEDVAEIEEHISTAEETNQKARKARERHALEADAMRKTVESAKLTDKIAEIDFNKEQMLATAKFPVDGLGFDEDGVTFNGIPFDQCSSAEQLRVSVGMGIALNPELKVLLIRDGSLLDENSLKLVADMAKKAGSQVWMERVSEGAECQVVIEDGMVKEVQ